MKLVEIEEKLRKVRMALNQQKAKAAQEDAQALVDDLIDDMVRARLLHAQSEAQE